MGTFIFTKIVNTNGIRKLVVVGMKQSEMFPSLDTRYEDSEFYGCECHEITEKCHVELCRVK